MKSIFIALILIGVLFGCKSKGDKEKLVKLELQELNIRIWVPKEHSLFKGENYVNVILNPDKRYNKGFTIKKMNLDIPKKQYSKYAELENGISIFYETFVADNPGSSGGKEYDLKGFFEFRNEMFLVTSSELKEYGEANAEFCLVYISSIEELK
ncbi:hypothetical protein [Aquimarina macrocephali]|uniref:hypothetical protein n=1 Tax=Aquimarina macrocephali TaxID=666563 RepID=UPI0004635165|nr:hypothetical protein [Aquimarina macrocephali]